MEIISVSLDKEALENLDTIQQRLGFKSRSKLLRSTITSLVNEYYTIDSIRGSNEIVLVITYKINEKNHISSLLHRFEHSIKTTIHKHHGRSCVDIIDIIADAKVIQNMVHMLKKNKCVRSVNFILVGKIG